MTEEALIQRLKNNDPAACKSLVDLCGSLVYNTALGLLHDARDAEDVAQEVFIQAFQSIGQFRSESKISTWIYRITVTKSLEFLRAKNRKKRAGFLTNLFDREGARLRVDKPHFEHPGVLIENKERARVLFLAIEKLPESQKTAFILSKMEDLSYLEIADVMQVTVPAVESLLFRARQNLKKILSDYYEENER